MEHFMHLLASASRGSLDRGRNAAARECAVGRDGMLRRARDRSGAVGDGRGEVVRSVWRGRRVWGGSGGARGLRRSVGLGPVVFGDHPGAGNGGAAGRGCDQAPRESGRRVEGAHKSGTYGRRHAQAPRQSAPRAELREKATKCVAFSLRLVLSGPRGSGVGVSAMREFALSAIGLSAGVRRPDRRWRRRTRVGAESRLARRIPNGADVHRPRTDGGRRRIGVPECPVPIPS
jgi:hypothetical protein